MRAHIFIGPDIGLVSAFSHHDEDASCKVSIQELATVSAQYFQECMDFLVSSEHDSMSLNIDCDIDMDEYVNSTACIKSPVRSRYIGLIRHELVVAIVTAARAVVTLNHRTLSGLICCSS